jgi:hypothetical protein
MHQQQHPEAHNMMTTTSVNDTSSVTDRTNINYKGAPVDAILQI